MRIQKIVMEDGVKSQLCNAACPTGIITEDDQVIIQGYHLEESETSQLTAPQGEGFVKMPLDVFKRIAEQL